jgi:nitroreductase
MTGRPDLGRADLLRAVETALRAPSVHNTQPWRWRIRTDTVINAVELHADRFRHLAATDPDRRDLLLSCGAALHHLRAALAAAGTAVAVDRFPDADDREHLATVTPVPGDRAAVAASLASAIPHRRTDRRQLHEHPVPRDLVDVLVTRAGEEGALLVPVTDPDRRALLLAVLTQADVLQRTHAGYMSELQRWTHRPHGGHDGIPRDTITAPPIGAGAGNPHRRFGAPGLAQTPTPPGSHPDGAVFLVLTTGQDTAPARLRAGEAVSAVLLAATRAGLATTPFSQAVEVDRSRQRLQYEVLGGVPETPQLVVRVGWPATGAAPLPPTPRRPLATVLLR